jgi:hypothetical protein
MRLAEKLASSYPIRVVPLPLPLPVLEEAMMWHPTGKRCRARVAARRAARDGGGLTGHGTCTGPCGAAQATTPPGLDVLTASNADLESSFPRARRPRPHGVRARDAVPSEAEPHARRSEAQPR